MKKRIVSFLVLVALLLNSSYPVFAQVQPSKYAKYSEKNNVPFTEENVNKYEKKSVDYSQYEKDTVNSLNTDGMDIVPYVIDPGEGAYQLAYTPLFNSGATYADTDKRASAISTILDLGYTIASYFFTTGMSIVIDISSYIYGNSSPNVALSSAGQIKLSHSYSYISKLGQVYTNGSWLTKVDIEKRMWFRHEYASWSENGYTRSGTKDFVPTTGYSEINTDYKTYYNDDNWIYNETMYRYRTYLPTYVSAFTH